MTRIRPPPYSPFAELAAGELRLRQLRGEDAEDIMEICFYDGEPARSKEQAK
jgi:hypothetical protein